MNTVQQSSPSTGGGRLGNGLSLLFEGAALLLALMAVRLTLGWPWGTPAEGIWPGLLTAIIHLFVATCATVLLTMYATNRVILRGVILGLGYLGAVYALLHVFLA